MRRLLFAACLAALLPSRPSADETIVSSGPPEDRLDLVFLGEGYALSDLPRYKEDVRRFSDHLFSQPPFSAYRHLFNVHRVDVASVQSGADDACAGRSVDTAFDAAYHPIGSDCRLLFTYSASKVYAAASRAPGYDPGAGLVVVIVNAEAYGAAAAAGGYVVVNRGGSGPEAMAHELGHSFGLLADEYEQPGRAYAGGEPVQPNVTIQTDRNQVKWSRWIASGLAGLFEGGMIHQYGIFRPTADSKMRSLNRPYDAVNESVLTARMDAWLPPTAALSAPAAGARVSGRVEVAARAEDGVGLAEVSLLVDGKPFGSPVPVEGTRAEARWEWDAAAGGEGPHALTVRAVDTAGNVTDRTLSVVAGSAPPAGGGGGPLVRKHLFLSPGLRDGLNDEVSLDEDAEGLTVFDVSGRVVHESASGASWDGEGAESGVYVARTRRRDGTEIYRTVMVVR